MSGFHPPGHTIPPQYYSADPHAIPNANFHHAPPTVVPHTSFPTALSDNPFHPGATGPYVHYADPSIQPEYGDQYDEMSAPLDPAQSANGRVRRRSGPSDQVKHRRTRSGCFTCRQRRVKCDETHPICERCRKGNRECSYPEAQPNPKSGRSGSKSAKSSSVDGASSPESQDGKDRLPTIPDDDEAEEDDYDEDVMSRSQELRDSPHTPASTLDHSTSPSTEASSIVPPSARPPLSRKSSMQAATTSPVTKSASAMARDLQFYLNYFQNHITIQHYSLKRDTNNFLKGELLARAMKFEPLKYAVAGYAAYFHTISQPEGRISTFLQFYNESVSRLRVAILKNKKQGLAIFLTILQLASIEEMLGDWVNLMGHQKAAFEMLKRLYTPQTITQSDFLLKVCHWYVRFDLFVGFQSGGEAVLGREWYEVIHERWTQKLRENPDDSGIKYEERLAQSRLVAKDSNDLFSRAGKGLVSPQDFMAQLPIMKQKVEGIESGIYPELMDPAYKIQQLPGEPNFNDVVNPYEPGLLMGGDLWTTNHLLLDAWGILIMHNISESMALKQPIDPEIVRLAYRAVQLCEAMDIYPDAPNGTMIETSVSFAISVLFLAKDPKTMWWVRRFFAKFEAAGYIFSDTLRNRILESMGEGPADWWLPNDEACPPIIRSIKNFIKDRTTAPKDQISDDLREMRGVLSSLTLSDSPSDNSTVTSADGSGITGGPGSAGFGSPEWTSGYGTNHKSPSIETRGSTMQYSVQFRAE